MHFLFIRIRYNWGRIIPSKKASDDNFFCSNFSRISPCESKTKICDKIANEINASSEFNANEKAELLANLNNKFKKSDNFEPPFDTVVSFYTGFQVACDFSVDSDVDDVQSGDTVIVKFVTKFGKTQVFGKNLCYVKLYPKAVKLEQHGKALIDTFSGMSEGDLV